MSLNAAEGHGAYDWHGDYVSIAVSSGNVAVLNVLLEGGYELKWQQAQVGGGHDCQDAVEVAKRCSQA